VRLLGLFVWIFVPIHEPDQYSRLWVKAGMNSP
jgi:hypothetical protein